MTVETATYINQLNAAYPADADAIPEGDNHIRLVKSSLLTTFSGFTGAAVTVTEAQINSVTSRSLRAGDTYTGTHDFTGATISVAPATSGSQPYTKTQVDSLVISATAPTWSITTTAVSKTLAAFEACEVTASGQTLTFPASPTAGVTRVAVLFRSGITGTFDPGSNKINESSGTMTCNQSGLGFQFLYVSSTKGWTPSRI